MRLHFPANFSTLGAPTLSKLLLDFIAVKWEIQVCHCP